MTHYRVAISVLADIDLPTINEWLREKNKGELLVSLHQPVVSNPGRYTSDVRGVQNWPRGPDGLRDELAEEDRKEGNLMVWAFEDKRVASAFKKKWGGDWF